VYAETRRWTGLDLQTVVRGDSKLIWDRAGQRFELYDLALDPGEKENLAASRPEEREELERLLVGHLADAEARALPVRVAEEVDAARLEKLRSLGYIR
jgi:arylsulfatase A-like enzyme